MKSPKLVKTKKSQLKVPVTTAGRKMQFYRNSNRSDSKSEIRTAQILKCLDSKLELSIHVVVHYIHIGSM